MRAPVMQGVLGNGAMNLPTILRAVSLSRQLTRVRIQDVGQQPNGEIQVKAGRLVSASFRGDSGKEAFLRIVAGNQSNNRFRVEKLDDEIDIPESLGMIGQLLEEVSDVGTSAVKRPPPHLKVAAPVAVPDSGVASAELAELGTCIDGLTALTVVGDSGRAAYWRRDQSTNNDGMSSLVAQLLQLSGALTQVMSVERQPEIIISGTDQTFVLMRVDDATVAAAAFGGQVAAGFARLQLSRLLEPIHELVSSSS